MTRPLLDAYRGVVCDLDGVVYRGDHAVPHAVAALTAAREKGVGIVFATNNASRPPTDVARQLAALGLAVDPDDVVTSSQAGARALADTLDSGSTVLAVGGPGVAVALEDAGLVPVTSARLVSGDVERSAVAAVLQGLGEDVSWRDLAEAAFAIQRGARWVATNADTTLPKEAGLAPGNGALVRAVRVAVDVDPDVVGKPHPPLYELAARVLGTAVGDTLAIGDRLDTDLAGAANTGMAGLYVATGVSSPRDVCLAPPEQRPRYLALDLRALGEPYEDPTVDGERARCGSAVAAVTPDGLELDGGDADTRLRALAAACWAAADAGLRVPDDDQVWRPILDRLREDA